MSKILNDVRAISSAKVAEKQEAAKNNYPKLIEKIKTAASFGNTNCELRENEVDQYSKRLLEQDGFSVYATTKRENSKYDFGFRTEVIVWVISW